MSIFPDCQCQTLQVSFANEALAHQSIKPGSYQLSGKINGKPSWKSAKKAIWYSTFGNGQWLMGELSKIGTNLAKIYETSTKEYACPHQVPTNLWVYWDEKIRDWKKASLNDISLQCPGKEEHDQTN